MQKQLLICVLSCATAFFILPNFSDAAKVNSVDYFTFQDSKYPGGFSGLFYLGKSASGNWRFLTEHDQGPKPQISQTLLRWIELEANPKTHQLLAIKETLLKDPQGRQLTGADLDPEGISIDDRGNRWMAEEIIPSILKFDESGKLLKRYIPKGSLSEEKLKALEQKYGPGILAEALPESYAIGSGNRGFEGITVARGKIYASLQKAIPNQQAFSNQVRILEFDPIKETVTGEFLYPLNVSGADKIGDIAFSPQTGDLFLVEQNSKIDSAGRHYLRKASLATNLLNPSSVADLSQPNYAFAAKIEGLAYIGINIFAFINDNDFKSEKATVLGIINYTP